MPISALELEKIRRGFMEYTNFYHYITDERGSKREAKRYFVEAAKIISTRQKGRQVALLDVGCANGDFISYITEHLEVGEVVGIDPVVQLIDFCKKRDQKNSYICIDGLSYSEPARFNVITALGLTTLFSCAELKGFYSRISENLMEEGVAIILSPMNDNGIDMEVRHRKYVGDTLSAWQPGWSIYTKETHKKLAKETGLKSEFIPFRPEIEIIRGEDPVRTWTEKNLKGETVIRNGMGLELKYYFHIVTK